MTYLQTLHSAARTADMKQWLQAVLEAYERLQKEQAANKADPQPPAKLIMGLPASHFIDYAIISKAVPSPFQIEAVHAVAIVAW